MTNDLAVHDKTKGQACSLRSEISRLAPQVSENRNGYMVRVRRCSPEARQELERMLIDLRSQAKPMTRDEFMRALAVVNATYWQAQGGQDEQLARAQMFWILLQDFNADLIQIAFRKHLQKQKFPPTPAHIYEIVERLQAERNANRETLEDILSQPTNPGDRAEC